MMQKKADDALQAYGYFKHSAGFVRKRKTKPGRLSETTDLHA